MASRHAALTGYYMVISTQVKPQVQEELGFSNTWQQLPPILCTEKLCDIIGGILGDMLVDILGDWPVGDKLGRVVLG